MKSRSANSTGKPKRSSSNTSKNSNSSDPTEKKKRKTNQKTLGMAWGANSSSSTRASSRTAPFTDFGSYMAVKNQKLQDQFDAEASSSSHGGSTLGQLIFQGVSIFVDGYTVPSTQELRAYMLKFGGRFENYFSRRCVTHIICSNLPASKIKNLRAFSRGLPVVKATWVLDSVQANKLLSWAPYQLDQLVGDTSIQPKLSSFFTTKQELPNNDSENAFLEAKEATESSSCMDEILGDYMPCKVQEVFELAGRCSGELDSFAPSGEGMNGEPSCASGTSTEVEMDENWDALSKEKLNPNVESQNSPCRSSASASIFHPENKDARGLACKADGLSCHSTLGDPSFVENYFKNSRLHFIGTWRNRYRKRFPSSSNRFTSSNPDASESRKAAIIHMDMDCFFVAVVTRNRPDLRNKPVAVCHSDNPRGTAEISSANYAAREYGVRAGTFVRDAKAICPHLVICPYNFEAYEEVADKFYDILHKYCNRVQAISCDEAFLEVFSQKEDPEKLASTIRRDIVDATGCTASAGIADNMLMARLATRTAKPDGQFYIPSEKVDDYLINLPVKALPGVGHVLEEKLKRRNILACGQLRMVSKETLQKDFGGKTGDMLWSYSRGIDNRLVGDFQVSKSLGAEVNWGVRFNDFEDSQKFISDLCKEVSLRLRGCGVQGRTFTLKIKKRREDAGEPAKYMGCGDCENLSHSITVPVCTDDADVLQRITMQLFGSFCIDVKDIRGVGLQVSKLETAEISNQGQRRISLQSWFGSASSSDRKLKSNDPSRETGDIDYGELSIDRKLGKHWRDTVPNSIKNFDSSSAAKDSSNHLSASSSSSSLCALPPVSDLDMEVVENLPPELFSEINEVYGGKLIDFVGSNRSVKVISCTKSRLLDGVEGSAIVGIRQSSEICSLTSRREGQELLELEAGQPCDRKSTARMVFLQHTERKNISEETGPAYISRPILLGVVNPHPAHPKPDIMPSSLSQIDISVLQELPEDLRFNILEQLPAHRQANAVSIRLEECRQTSLGVTNYQGCSDFIDENLWAGNPHFWVYKFRGSRSLILNVLVEMYNKLGSATQFSLILQCTMSDARFLLGTNCDSSDEVIFSLCELFKQYIKLKVESDIEEIYICFRLLRRLVVRSALFSQVYDTVLPYLQASVNEHYGGNLCI